MDRSCHRLWAPGIPPPWLSSQLFRQSACSIAIGIAALSTRLLRVPATLCRDRGKVRRSTIIADRLSQRCHGMRSEPFPTLLMLGNAFDPCERCFSRLNLRPCSRLRRLLFLTTDSGPAASRDLGRSCMEKLMCGHRPPARPTPSASLAGPNCTRHHYS